MRAALTQPPQKRIGDPARIVPGVFDFRAADGSVLRPSTGPGGFLTRLLPKLFLDGVTFALRNMRTLRSGSEIRRGRTPPARLVLFRHGGENRRVTHSVNAAVRVMLGIDTRPEHRGDRNGFIPSIGVLPSRIFRHFFCFDLTITTRLSK